MKSLYLTISLLIFLFINLFSQQDSIPEIVVPEVIIYENRLSMPFSQKPSSVSIINSKSILTSPSQSLSDLLSSVPGVDIRQRGPNGVQSDVGIRGSTFDQVLILVNGIKVSDPQTGHHSLNLPFDLQNISQIEVFKGPSARVFGQNAFAGAINIITKKPSESVVRLQSSAGAFGLTGGGISISLARSRISNYLSISHTRASGYRYNSDYRISDIFYQSGIQTGIGAFNILGAFSGKKFGANGFYSGPEFTEQYEEISTSIASVEFIPDFNPNSVRMATRLYWRNSVDDYMFIRSDPSFYRNLHNNNTAGIDINFSSYNSLGITGIGLDFNVPWIESTRLGSRVRNNLTLFLEHRFTLLKESFIVTPGIQIIRSSGFNNKFLPGIDLSYNILPNLSAFLNSGYTYRVPTFTDLYYEDPANSSNPDLEPELAFSNEIGIKTLKTRRLSGQLSYFKRNNHNLIDRYKNELNEKWKPGNILETSMNGVDLSIEIHPGDVFHSGNNFFQRFSFGYNYINSRIEGTIPDYSKFAFENLRNQFVVGCELKYFTNFFTAINFRYSDRVNLEDYTVTDTRLGWNNGTFSSFIDISNIFNTEYRETNFVILPGRWIKAGVSIKLKLKN